MFAAVVIGILTLSTLQTKTNTYANSVDPDHYELCHQDLNCLLFGCRFWLINSLRKYAYSNMRILPRKTENFQMKNCGSFHISAQNIDCGYVLELPQWGGSKEYP